MLNKRLFRCLKSFSQKAQHGDAAQTRTREIIPLQKLLSLILCFGRIRCPHALGVLYVCGAQDSDAGDTAINDRRIDYVFGPPKLQRVGRVVVLRDAAVGRMDHWPLLVEVGVGKR